MISDEIKKSKKPYLLLRAIHKKLIVDDKGMPTEVIIPWKEYLQIEELLGLDLGADARDDLKKARQDPEPGNKDAFDDLDSL